MDGILSIRLLLCPVSDSHHELYYYLQIFRFVLTKTSSCELPEGLFWPNVRLAMWLICPPCDEPAQSFGVSHVDCRRCRMKNRQVDGYQNPKLRSSIVKTNTHTIPLFLSNLYYVIVIESC